MKSEFSSAATSKLWAQKTNIVSAFAMKIYVNYVNIYHVEKKVGFFAEKNSKRISVFSSAASLPFWENV